MAASGGRIGRSSTFQGVRSMRTCWRRCCGGCRIPATERACWRTIRADCSDLTTRLMAVQLRKPKPLKVALAGAGMISWYHLVSWRNLDERVRLVAVCDPYIAKAAKRAKEV